MTGVQTCALPIFEDGYLPAFQPVAGAVAAVTERIRISNDIALLPLYHPIRLAEELAVLDQLSNGRMEFGIGMGYVPKEFEAFGHDVRHRVSLTEEAIEIMRQAWSDGPVDFAGKRVGMIGTGSTGIQAAPVIASQAEHLTVFQRTANYSVPAQNHPLTPEFKQWIKSNADEIRTLTRETLNGQAFRISEKSALATPAEVPLTPAIELPVTMSFCAWAK